MITVTINNQLVELHSIEPTEGRPLPAFWVGDTDDCYANLGLTSFNSCDSCPISTYQTGTYCIDNVNNYINTSDLKSTYPELFI